MSGLTQPTAVRFAKDGRIFVAEKSGLIKLFDPGSAAPAIFADLRTQVYNFWDRGLLDLELHPDFPNTPYVYVLYTRDAALAENAPRWGSPGGTSDRCPTPPGSQAQGCVASGRLSRLTAAGDAAFGGEHVLLENWPVQFPSHATGSLAFGPDGMLYVSAGDGASFDFVDYGQLGEPNNPLADPPVRLGEAQTPPAARGGALRAQNLSVPGYPVQFDGKIVRLDPETGRAASGNPLAGEAAPIVAYGLRNPFRFSFRPGTGELWIGDVGWETWEEINRVVDPLAGPAANFGWPCFEGAARQDAYAATNLAVCNALYAQPSARAPYYAYRHDVAIVEGDACDVGQGAITGLAFYSQGLYPAEYRGALFFSDYTRNCIYVMLPGADGLPDPGQRRVFGSGTRAPVQLLIGPGNDLYYTSIAGSLHRISALGNNQPPTAAFTVTPSNGAAPLTVDFDARASSDADPGDNLTYSWDLDGDGVFGDARGVSASYVYGSAGERTVSLRVSDSRGAVGESMQTVAVSGEGGTAAAQITRVEPSQFKVGDVIHVEGVGLEGETQLPAATLQWDLVVQHCQMAGRCHPHVVESFSGASADFHAPDHEYPYYLELILRVTGSDGRQSTTLARIDPITIDVTLDSTPGGLMLALNHAVKATPFTSTVVAGSVNTVSAPDYAGYHFSGWSDARAQTHLLSASTGPLQLTAAYEVDAAPVNLKQFGEAVARVSQPAGGGNPSPDVMRDEDYPSPGTADSRRQFDSFNGDVAAKEDWVGYEFGGLYSVQSVTFQEGRNFFDGGWFERIDVRVRRAGVWSSVRDLQIDPAYPGTSDVVGFRTYQITFEPILGDAIQVFGPAGGAARFISVAELDVFGRRAAIGPAHAPRAQTRAFATDVIAGERVTLDGRHSFDLNGDPLSYSWVQTAGPSVTLSDATRAAPSFMAPRSNTRTRLAFTLTVSDGALTSEASLEVNVAASSVAVDVTARGKPFVSETRPAGGGSPELQVIRDGIEPATGSTDYAQQYDTFSGEAGAVEGFVGYEFAQPFRFSLLRFVEGGNFLDGGWFDSVKVQIRQQGRYFDAGDLRITPAYQGGSSSPSFQGYLLSFTPAVGDAIRIYGAPGGTSRFFSVAELRAFAVGALEADAPPLAAAGADFSAPDSTLVSLDGSAAWDPDGGALSYQWLQVSGPTVELSGADSANPTFMTPFVFSPTQLTFRLIVRDAAQSSAPDEVTVEVSRTRDPIDVSAGGRIIVHERRPIGFGSRSPEVIRDGTRPAASSGAELQYDTFSDRIYNLGYIGYLLDEPRVLSRVELQEGVHFANGGFFAWWVTVQVLRSGAWRDVSGLTITPAYASAGAPSWQTYAFNFTPAVAEGVRIAGFPGGGSTFISAAELRAYTP